MKKQKKWMATMTLVLCASMVFTACGDNANTNQTNGSTPPTEATSESNKEQANKDSKENTTEDEGTQGEKEPTTDPASGGISPAIIPVTVADLEGTLNIGDSSQAVIDLAGEEYKEVTTVMDGSKAWRYDIGAADDYSYDNDTDTPDIEGLKSGKVILQIFVTFDDEGKVSGYTAYQRGENDTVHAFYTFENGERKNETIQ